MIAVFDFPTPCTLRYNLFDCECAHINLVYQKLAYSYDKLDGISSIQNSTQLSPLFAFEVFDGRGVA